MEERVALITDVHETGVKSGHEFADFGVIDVAYGEVLCPALCLKLYKFLVFKQRDRDLLWLDIDDYFAGHKRYIEGVLYIVSIRMFTLAPLGTPHLKKCAKSKPHHAALHCS